MTFPVPGGSTFLRARNNLADVGSEPAALANLGGNLADMSLLVAPAGATAETFPRTTSGGYTNVLVSGQSIVSILGIPAGVTVNNLGIFLGSTAFATVTHAWIALMDPGLVVRAVTADQTTSFQAPFTNLKLPVTAPYVVPVSAPYYLVASVVAGTMGTISGGTQPLSVPNGAPPIVSGTSSGGLSTPPAVGSSLGAIAAANWRFYGYTA
jgi:hypothetical protein